MAQPIQIDLSTLEDGRPSTEIYTRALYMQVLNSFKYGWRHSAILKFFVMNSVYSYLPQSIELALQAEANAENLPETKAALTALVRGGYLRNVGGRYEVNFPEGI